MSTLVHPPLDSRGVARGRTALATGAAATVVAFLLTPVLFEPGAGLPAPAGLQLPLFVVLTALEAVAFGAGVALLVAGRGVLAPLFTTPARLTAVHAALTWALISWWPHDGLHMANGTNITGLLGIEYGFHVSLMAAAAVLVWAMVREARGERG